MRRRPLLLVPLSLAVLALAGTGCGGGDEDGARAAAGDAVSEYVDRATALCGRERREISERLDEVVPDRRGASLTGPAAARAMKEVVLPGFRAQYEGLRRLWPPRGDEDFLDLMLSKLSRALEIGEGDLERFFRPKLSSYSEFAEGTLMTEEYGIQGCGSQNRSAQAVVASF